MTKPLLPVGTRVRFTRDDLGASERDDLAHVVGERAMRGHTGVVAFAHPNRKLCPDWFYVEIDSRRRPGVKLYVGVRVDMVEVLS